MLEIVYGTGNPGKVRQMQAGLGLYDIKVRGISEFDVQMDVPEDGRSPEENARKKAQAYVRAVHLPVLSMDSALYFKGVPQDQQPGLFVRRFGGDERATDAAMLAHYIRFIDRFGGRLDGYWESAFALALPDGTIDAMITTSPRIFVSEPYATVTEGNPLVALQIDPATGKRLPEMTPEELVQTTHAYMTPLAAFLLERLR